VTVEDGRRYLQQHDERWDAIVIDAYFSDSLPFHLTTIEFLELARSRLVPRGVIAANLIGQLSGEGSQLFRAMYKTYRAVFPTVAVHPVRDQEDSEDDVLRNLIVVAGDGASPGEDVLLDRWRELRARSPRAADLTKAIRDRYTKLVPTRDVPLLTDDFAPTDALLFVN
jgi:spermidine synthase